MACCLKAPSHYLNQCWLLINGILRHSLSQEQLYSMCPSCSFVNEFENHVLKYLPHIPGAIELIVTSRKVLWSRGLGLVCQSSWNLTGVSAAVQRTRLSNVNAIRKYLNPISWVRDFARSEFCWIDAPDLCCDQTKPWFNQDAIDTRKQRVLGGRGWRSSRTDRSVIIHWEQEKCPSFCRWCIFLKFSYLDSNFI